MVIRLDTVSHRELKKTPTVGEKATILGTRLTILKMKKCLVVQYIMMFSLLGLAVKLNGLAVKLRVDVEVINL